MENVSATAERMRRLEVKGARNVAIAALQAIDELAQKTKAKNRKTFLQELMKARRILFASRPTEPLMRNAVNWVLCNVDSSEKTKVSDLSRVVASCSCEFLRSLEQSREQIAEIGANRIPNGAVIFTHCHSSTVTSLAEEGEGKREKLRGCLHRNSTRAPRQNYGERDGQTRRENNAHCRFCGALLHSRSGHGDYRR